MSILQALAENCLYGVDINPVAIEVAKLSLWMLTLNLGRSPHPYLFLNHKIKCGDALVGVLENQLAELYVDSKTKTSFFSSAAQHGQNEIARSRSKISDETSFENKQTIHNEAEKTAEFYKIVGDRIVESVFKHRAKSLQKKGILRFQDEMRFFQNDLLHDDIKKSEWQYSFFHWSLEFPEVFIRENSGFDAIVGNPPFMGKNTIARSMPENYIKWLLAIHEESEGGSDIAAHFFRRTFDLLSRGGCFGLIATNSISQGATRRTGLRHICVEGEGIIYNATRSYKWPGSAAVTTSVVHVQKPKQNGFFFGPNSNFTLSEQKLERLKQDRFQYLELAKRAKLAVISLLESDLEVTLDDAVFVIIRILAMLKIGDFGIRDSCKTEYLDKDDFVRISSRYRQKYGLQYSAVFASNSGDLLPNECFRRIYSLIRFDRNEKTVPFFRFDVEFIGYVYEELLSVSVDENGDITKNSLRRFTGSHYTPREQTVQIVARTLEPILARTKTMRDLLNLKILDPTVGGGAFLIEACRQLADHAKKIRPNIV